MVKFGTILLAEGRREDNIWKLSQKVLPNGIILGDGGFYFSTPIIKHHIKAFMLDSGNEDGWYWTVQAIILPTGVFLNSGKVNTEKIRDNRKLIERRIRIHNRRKRGLGFIKITPPLGEDFDWHHIDKDHVVAAPRKLHRSIKHILENKQSMVRINKEIEKWYMKNINEWGGWVI